MDNRIYRECVRVLIIRNDLILLGKKIINNKFVCYEFPGGGIEKGNTFEDTVIKECLEEVGILVNNVRSLNLRFQYDISYPDPERAKVYKGGADNWFICDYVRSDKHLHDSQKDALPYIWVAPEKAIRLIQEGPESSYNPARLKAISELVSKVYKKHHSAMALW